MLEKAPFQGKFLCITAFALTCFRLQSDPIAFLFTLAVT
jgi:hypothetical protein